MDGVLWPTSEHYFQAMKFPHAPDLQARIQKVKSPGYAKKLAWTAGVVLRPDWDSYRVDVMRRVVRAKFSQRPDLRAILLGTGDELLVEHTERDSFWGDGGDGSGQNMLGQLLMEVRAELQATP